MGNELIIGNQRVSVSNLRFINYLDNQKLNLSLGKNKRNRKTNWIRSIVLHTTKGIPGGSNKTSQLLLEGYGKNQNAGERCVEVWKDVTAGAHLVVDFDGTIYQCADLLKEATYHAGQVNEVSIGVEIYQGAKAELYKGQLEVVVQLIDILTALLEIQRQYHAPYNEKSLPKRIASKEFAGKDVVGIYGHRDVTNTRGFGDPGDYVFQFLKEAGYESFDFSKNEDKEVWKERQIKLGLTPDGIPGPQTVQALKRAGHISGMWVKR